MNSQRPKGSTTKSGSMILTEISSPLLGLFGLLATAFGNFLAVQDSLSLN